MGFCATWAGPAIFQQRFATNHWLWVRPLTDRFYFVIFKFRLLIYIVTGADTATNTQAAQSPGRCVQATRKHSFLNSQNQILCNAGHLSKIQR